MNTLPHLYLGLVAALVLPCSRAAASRLSEPTATPRVNQDHEWRYRTTPPSSSWDLLPDGFHSELVTHPLGMSTAMTLRPPIQIPSIAPTGSSHRQPSALARRVPHFPVLFNDGFETYATGAFPSAGGWQNHFGSSLGMVIPPGCTNGNSLQLVGASCWADVAYHPVAMTNRVRFETCVNAAVVSQYGCGPGMVFVGFWDPPPASQWGIAHDFIYFAPDGNIYLGQGTILQGYSPNTWHRIAIVADFTAGVFDIEIDGTLYPGNQGSTQIPQGIALMAGHGTSPDPVALFDSVRVLAQ